MARRIETTERVDVRAELRALFARSIELWGETTTSVSQGETVTFRNPDALDLALLDAGEPVTVPGWRLTRHLTPEQRVKHHRWTVRGDGTLEPAPPLSHD